MINTDLQKILFFTRINCSDSEFLGKLQVYQKFQPVLEQLYLYKKNDKNPLVNYFGSEFKNLQVQPLFYKMLQDYISIIEKDKKYFYFISNPTKVNFDISEFVKYDTLITYFNNTKKVHKNENFDYFKDKMVKIIKDLLNKLENYNTHNRILTSMIIYKILETEFGELFMQKFPKFKLTVSDKIKEFSNEHYPSFCEYFKENYVIDKKYISKYRNKKYNLQRLKTILFTSYVFLSKLKEIKEKRLLEKQKSWFQWFS
jgi:hypothetical protein